MEELCAINTDRYCQPVEKPYLVNAVSSSWFIIITDHHLNNIPATPPEKIVMAVYSNKAPFELCQLHAEMPDKMTKLLT